MPIAELNIAKVRGPMDSPVMKDFADGINAVNAKAESSDGFVWRYIDGTDDHENYAPTPWADEYIVNMSVWRDGESLKAFVFDELHVGFMKRRKEWFHLMKEAYFCLWYVDEGHIPTLEEAKQRLDYLEQHGPTDQAFGWREL